MRANASPIVRNRVRDRLSGDLHDTLMLSLFREAQPLPESIAPGQVRALHSSQLLDLIRDVLLDHDKSWTQRMEKLGVELRQLQEGKTSAEAQRDATTRYEIPRLALLVDQERDRADSLCVERDALKERVLALEAAAAKASVARRSRLARLERAVELLEANGAADQDERESLEARLEQSEASLTARTQRARTLLADRDAQLASLRRRGAELTATLRAHQHRVHAVNAEASGLREERELVNAAMSAADDVLAALEGELKSASTVQRLSKRLGTISSPKGADHLRGTRTDYPLFAELLKAQEALQKGWAGVGSASRDLAGIRKAVGDRLAGTAWLTQELRHTRLALAESRDQYKTLQREQRLAEDSLSEQGRRIVDLEDKVTALTFDTASSRRDADSTRSELALAQEKLKTATIRTATLRKTEAFKRAEIEGEAIRALEAADAERERLEVGRADLEAEVAIARERGRTSRLKVERLMRALHRDEARGQA